MPKRAVSEDLSESETVKKNKPDVYVSATDIRNYLHRDPIVDWLKLYWKGEGSRKTSIFHEYIMKAGVSFEEKVISQLKEIIPVMTVLGEGITEERCEDTISLMRAGIPAIHSGCFRSGRLGIQGIPDLLVRTDYLHLLGVTDFKPERTSPYYVVIDIKFSTLPLRANGRNILNTGKYPAYKGQLWVYTQCLGEIQGITPNIAYLMGRRWKYISKGEVYSERTGKLGEVDFSGVDGFYAERAQKAIDWVRKVRKEGHTWTVSPPTVPELYPNMCVDSPEWNEVKRKIALEIGEITLLWYCGTRHREIAHGNGIFTWRNPRCKSYNIGMGGSRAKVVDSILRTNRGNAPYMPKKIKNNLYTWKQPCNEAFVDFETFCDVSDNGWAGIFMIGVWYRGEYTNFTAKDDSPEGELEIMQNFIDFLDRNGRPALWYWYADANIWTRAENRQMDRLCEEGRIEDCDNIVDHWRDLYWCDLCEIFRYEPVTVKGCFKFGLKEIAGALKTHGLVETTLTSSCKSGLDAAILAKQVYEKGRIIRKDRKVLTDIAEYNRYDVKILEEILKFLRTIS